MLVGRSNNRLVLVDPAEPTRARLVIESTESLHGQWLPIADAGVGDDQLTLTWWDHGAAFYIKDRVLYRLDLTGPTAAMVPEAIVTDRPICAINNGATRLAGVAATANLLLWLAGADRSCSTTSTTYGVYDANARKMYTTDVSTYTYAAVDADLQTLYGGFDRWYVVPYFSPASARWLAADTAALSPIQGRASTNLLPTIDGYYLLDSGPPVRFLPYDSDRIVDTALKLEPGTTAWGTSASPGELFFFVHANAPSASVSQRGVYQVPMAGAVIRRFSTDRRTRRHLPSSRFLPSPGMQYGRSNVRRRPHRAR